MKKKRIQVNHKNLLNSLKEKSNREANLFFSLCEGQNFVESKKLKKALNNSGLQSGDNRPVSYTHLTLPTRLPV